MKKIVLLLMAVVTLAYITKAQTKQNQFVKWISAVPQQPSIGKQVSWLKDAMKGNNKISGAEVRSKADNYIAVWGEGVYEQVLTAPESKFKPGLSKGNEINWGINPTTGNAEKSGTLAEGVSTINFLLDDGREISIAKYGANGCFNALTPVLATNSFTNDGVDPDNQVLVKNNDQPKLTNPGSGNTNTINFTPGTNQTQDTWESGYAKYKLGVNDRQNDFLVDASLYTSIQAAKQCCGGGNTQPTQTYATAQPTMYTMPVAQPVAYQQVQQKVPFGQTWFGQTTAVAAGGLLEDGIEALTRKFSGGSYYNQPPNYNYGGYTNSNSGYFYGSNQQGNIYPTGGIQTTGTNGGYSNTQPWPH